MHDSTTPVSPEFPLPEADRCVLCGLCLPHCPTYQLTEDENESPRGRISLMRALATGQLLATDAVRTHLSRCLACRSCERVCPSGVHYGQILEAGRAQQASQSTHAPWPIRFLLSAIANPRRIRRLATLLRGYQHSGLQWLARKTGITRLVNAERYDRMLPAIAQPAPWQRLYPAEGNRRGRVALFLGCVTRAIDPDSLAAAIRLLTRFGYEVLVPERQGCCGALHREAGDPAGARGLLERNREAFADLDVEALITVASGCGAALADPPRGAAAVPVPVRDLHAFLADQPLPQDFQFAPLAQHVLVHDPCTLRNVLRSEPAVYRLLERIPGLRVSPLPGNAACCGGAGGYVLREPGFADRLRAPKIQSILDMRPDLLVSANIGCLLHIGSGLRAHGLPTPVLHPAVLLDRQLRPTRSGVSFPTGNPPGGTIS